MTEQTITLHRTATNNQGHRYTAIGPLDNNEYGTWNHQQHEWAGRFEYGCDATDLMFELAGE